MGGLSFATCQMPTKDSSSLPLLIKTHWKNVITSNREITHQLLSQAKSSSPGEINLIYWQLILTEQDSEKQSQNPCSTPSTSYLSSSLRSLLWHHLSMGCSLLQVVSTCSRMESYKGCRWISAPSQSSWATEGQFMVPWSSPWAVEESLLFLPGGSLPLPSLALVSEGAVSLTFTHSTFSQLLQSFYPFLRMLLQGHHQYHWLAHL